MKTYLTFCLLCCALFSSAQKIVYNVDAEMISPATKMPKDWLFSFNEQQKDSYEIKVDNAVKQSGEHSISIRKRTNQAQFGVIDYTIPQVFMGKTIELKGFIKMEQVDSGFVGLWMRIDGKEGSIAFNNMQDQKLKGTSDWKEYTINLPYDSDAARTIHIGGLLAGSGTAWFDGFQLFIDGIEINQAPIKPVILLPADLDTAFAVSSGIAPFKITPQIINNLTLAGQFWGFLKYYHPSVAKGDYNWDAELFRFLPGVILAKNNKELNMILESYLDKIGTPMSEVERIYENVALKPDYGRLFDRAVCSQTLTDKLLAVKNAKRTSSHYYVSMIPGIGNPKFEHEKPYAGTAYPDAGYRILSLYRYWAMINYFFPYKDVMGTDWNKQLSASIPEFVEAENAQAYVLATLKIIAKINDTHANIPSNNERLNQFKGKNKLPFKARFYGDKLVVSGYYSDTLNVRQKFQIGDIVTAINGKPLEKMIKEFLPYTAASNYDTQLRDLPGFLLRGNTESFTVALNRAGTKIVATTPALPVYYYGKANPAEEKTAFRLLNDEIGYVYPGKYKNADLPAIRQLFKNTKGIIVDMRCYPSDFMPFTFGSYIKSGSTPFVKFTKGELLQPGLFTYTPALKNGEQSGSNYKGHVIVIVNATSQSQAEYTTMAFQSSPNVKVIGSTTAGADGNVSPIILPGGISTMISGIGVFYPDGTPTQRVGVKIDYVLKPTVKGLVEGKDELLEKAKEMLGSLSK